MSALWTAEEAAQATGGQVRGDWSVTGVSIDTRSLQQGDLFVALKAARDGHDFVADALANGAGAALVSRIPDGVAEDAPLLIVEDVLNGLEALGRAARARTKAKVIAVTGSVGKTTVKEMLRAALSDQGRTHAAEASYNNHWGVPLTLARMPAETEFAIIEIGMNAPDEIAPLTRMAQPHVAIVTTVAEAHLEAFGQIEGIAHEKASIFEGLVAGGIALANADLETSDILFAKAHDVGAGLIRFGAAPEAEAHLTEVTLSDTATVIRANFPGVEQLFKLAVPGRHLASNAVAVLAAVQAAGGDIPQAAMALGQWQPYSGRGTRERLVLSTTDDLAVELIDDAYNANPASIAASLEVLAASQPELQGRRLAVLGDMRELGAAGPELHAEIADLASVESIDLIYTSGELMQHLHDALPELKRGLHTENSDEMARALPRQLQAGDVVLIKGSNGSKLSRVVDGLRKLGQSVAEKR